MKKSLNLLYAAIAAIVLLACLAGCKDEDPPKTLNERLQGAWERQYLQFTQTYSFDGHGQCLEYAIIPGQPVQIYAMAYKCHGDTLSLINLASSSDFRDECRAIVSFSEDGDTARLAWLDGIDYVLVRL